MRSLLLFALVVAAGGLRATTIDPLTWEELARDCDFNGAVECTRAGGIVAEYKVIESWHGAKAGETVRIKVAVNYWGPQYPMAFVGQRFAVTAFKNNAPIRMMSTTSGDPVPLWWREIKYDYSLPLFQGRNRLDSEDELKREREVALHFYKFTSSQREAAVLKAVARKRLGDDRNDEDGDADKVFKELLDSLEKLTEAKDVLAKLAAYATKNRKSELGSVLRDAGERETLNWLQTTKLEEIPFDKDTQKRVLEVVKERVSPAEPRKRTEPEPEAAPAEERLAQLRTEFGKGKDDREEFWEAFQVLTEHDPEPVAKWLLKWRPKRDHWSSDERPYFVGSYFCFKCGKERAKNLECLLGATENGIKVSAAVYLCFEDAAKGEKALREYTKLPGRAGGWAALTLARRGHKDQMERLLQLIGEEAKGGMEGEPVEQLQIRVLELLSNSAAASGVEQPPLGPKPKEATHEELLRAWWKSHGDKIALADPWAKELAVRKVD